MKSTYPGFYSTPDDILKKIWNEESTLFIFDTNCLLNLYRCEDDTRKEILNVMKTLASRTWIPFQIGYEYQKNRRMVIQQSIESLETIQVELKRSYTHNVLSQGSIKKDLNTILSQEISDLQKKIEEIVDSYIILKIKSRIDSRNDISKHDFIRDEIDKIINEHVGELPTQDEINDINDEGEKRYKNEIPPGFKDKKTETNFFSGIELKSKFGDLYLWMEIIKKASSPEINSVIFVCDDNKSDWWFIQNGKTHGPLESLKTEICKKSSIDNFSLITQSTFLQHAKKYLGNVTISESSVNEVEVLSNISTSEKNTNSDSSFDSEYHSSCENYSNQITHGFSNNYIELPSVYAPSELPERISVRIESVFNRLQHLEARAVKLISKTNLIEFDKLNKLNIDVANELFILKNSLVDRINHAKDIKIKIINVVNEDIYDSDRITYLIKRLEKFIYQTNGVNDRIESILNNS